MALILGNENVIAEIEGTTSYSTDFSDFFRLDGERYIRMSDQNIPALLDVGMIEHSATAVKALLRTLGAGPEEYDYAIFQAPYGFVPSTIGRAVGFGQHQIDPGLIAPKIGDCGAATSLLSLGSVLDIALPGQRILVSAYGFGAGADAFSLKVTPSIEQVRGKVPTVRALLEDKKMVDYATAAKFEYKYVRPEHAISTYT